MSVSVSVSVPIKVVPPNQISLIPSIIKFVVLFSISAGLVYITLQNFLPAKGNVDFHFPRTYKDMSQLYKALVTGKGQDDLKVIMCYALTYIFLQSFAIPGSVMLSVLGGMLWGSWKALPIVCFCAATGASICYLISLHLGQVFVQKYLSSRMIVWNKQLEEERQHLFSYIVFVRVAPFFPNWFVNVASPHLDVGLNVFFWATLFGVAPLSFIHVQAGETIRITGTEQVSFFTPRNLVSMSLIAVAVFVSAYIRRKYSNKLNKLD